MNRIKENLEEKYNFLIESQYYKEHYAHGKFIYFKYVVPNINERSVIKVPDCEVGVKKDLEILLNEEVKWEYKRGYKFEKNISSTPNWFQELFNRAKEKYDKEVRLTRETNK